MVVLMKFILKIISSRYISSFISRKCIGSGISGAMLLLGSYAAQAQVASVSEAVFLRQGPGAAYGRIATLPRGVNVHINICRGGWCQIRSSWGVGWVSGRYLRRGYALPHYASNDTSYSFRNYDSDYYAPQSGVFLGLNIGSGHSRYDYNTPYYHPNGPRYFSRPVGREGWSPRWGVGPAYFPSH